MKQLEANLQERLSDNKYLRARVYSMYGGNAHLVVSKVYSDIRFVGAPLHQ